jgi:hypothetical protein
MADRWPARGTQVITLDDGAIVAPFVAWLSENGHPGLSVRRRPVLGNGDASDIEAVAGPFAIAHTSVNTIEKQRRDSTWFSRVAQSLENQV